jgi:hypothetical protein
LTVPQAPTQGGGKLIITAALAETRRRSGKRGEQTEFIPSPRVSPKRPATYLFGVIGVAVLVAGGFLYLKFGDGSSGSGNYSRPNLWTDNVAELRLLKTPATGRLNGWDFSANTAFWRDTRLILRQNSGQPEGLRLQITFPLQGGELVPGKTFRLGRNDPPFATPPRISWKNAGERDHHEPVAAGYVLWATFDDVSAATVSGRIHICLPDTARSWVAGSFSAENRTRLE